MDGASALIFIALSSLGACGVGGSSSRESFQEAVRGFANTLSGMAFSSPLPLNSTDLQQSVPHLPIMRGHEVSAGIVARLKGSPFRISWSWRRAPTGIGSPVSSGASG